MILETIDQQILRLVTRASSLPSRFKAILTFVVGLTIAQAVVVTFKPVVSAKLAHRSTNIAHAHGEVAGVGSSRVPSAKNPAEFIERVEVYHVAREVQSPNEALAVLELNVVPEDIVQFFPDPSLGLGSKVTVIRATPTMLDNGGSRAYLRTFATTVKELLKEQGVDLGEKDMVDPALNDPLWWGGRVIITRVEEGEYKAVEDIRYDIEIREDMGMYKDEVKVIREGKRGQKEVHALARRENGEEVARVVLSEKVLKKPVSQIEVRGGKHRPTTGRWEDLINEIAPRYWADPAGLTKIMMCESGGNLTSYNPAGPYYGMFQFDEYTFTRIAGYPMDMIHDARAQIDGAAKLYSARYWHWPVCSRGT